MKNLCILFTAGYLTSAGVAQGATYYVSKAGNDGNSCARAQSVSSPKLTLGSGSACLSAGDTLVVRGGRYAEALKDFPSGTSWSSKVRIAAYQGETVWLRPTADAVVVFSQQRYVELDGINIDGTNAASATVVLGENSNHIRLKNAEIIGSPTSGWCAAICGGSDSEFLNLTVHGGGPTQDNCGSTRCNSFGIYTGGDNNLIDGCDIYDPGGSGIQIYHGSGAGAAANNIIRNNRIHDITRTGDNGRMWGIIIGSGSNNQVYNNIIYNGLGNQDGNNAGIYVYAASGTSIYNNTVYNVKAHGILISGPSSGTQVKNNVAYLSTGENYNNAGYGTVASNNIFDSDPLFENSGSYDFRLQSGSPARDRGTTLAAVTNDFQGVLRPQGGVYDIGAYEYQPEQSPLPRTPAAPTGLFIITN